MTKYQKEILEGLAAARDARRVLDLDEILSGVSWEPTKESFQFTLRAMTKRGWIERTGFEIRRGKKRVLVEITEEGFSAVKSPDKDLVEAPPGV